jgi:hypothetical protein
MCEIATDWLIQLLQRAWLLGAMQCGLCAVHAGPATAAVPAAAAALAETAESHKQRRLMRNVCNCH